MLDRVCGDEPSTLHCIRRNTCPFTLKKRPALSPPVCRSVTFCNFRKSADLRTLLLEHQACKLKGGRGATREVSVHFLSGDEVRLSGVSMVNDIKVGAAKAVSRFAPEVTVMCRSTGRVLIEDAKDIPSAVHVILHPLDYTTELWIQIIRAHARADDADGVRRAVSCIRDADATEGHRRAKACLDDALADEVKTWNTPRETHNEQRSLPSIKLLLTVGADVNRVDHKHETVLFAASRRGHIEAVKLFLDMGANVNHVNRLRKTALFKAVEHGHSDVVLLLLTAGACVDHRDNADCTPLHSAAEQGHVGVAELLLAHGAKINHVSSQGNSCLFWAAQNGHVRIIDLLLSKGADIHLINTFGETSLFCAVKRGRVDMIKRLIAEGADMMQYDGMGRMPLDIARGFGHAEVEQILLDALIPSLVKLTKTLANAGNPFEDDTSP